jgi:hypothetical protein
MMRNTLIILSLLLALPVLGQAQISLDRDVIANAGNEVSTSTLQMSWTVGEMAVATATNTNLIITEGFQQADEQPVAIDESRDFNTEITVYPNPVSDLLYFEVSTDDRVEMEATLYDISGRKITSIPAFRVLGQHRGQLDMSQLPAGEWLLRFTDKQQQQVRSFMVTKIN